MTKEPQNLWKDCNCINCRLARIEDTLRKITTMMDNLPAEFEVGHEKTPS